jgi:hypothetical protein
LNSVVVSVAGDPPTSPTGNSPTELIAGAGKSEKRPQDVLKFFHAAGAERAGNVGVKIGGKRSLETMTPEERTARRAKKAAAASAKVCSKKARRKSAAKGE